MGVLPSGIWHRDELCHPKKILRVLPPENDTFWCTFVLILSGGLNNEIGGERGKTEVRGVVPS